MTDIKIGVLQTEPGDAVEFYRGWGVMRYLEGESGEGFSVQFFDPDKVTPAALYQVDVLYCLRPFSPLLADIFEDAKRIGVKVWIDFDDDLFNVPMGHQAFFTLASPPAKKAISGFAKMADLVTVSTKELEERFKPINDNTVIVRNAWNDYKWPRAITKAHIGLPVKVSWRGGSTHSADLETVRPTLAKLIENKRYELCLHGFIPYWLKGTFSATPYVPIFKWFDYLDTLDADAFIFPLQDTPFNRSKSDISYLEATKAGAVCFAPDNMPEFDRPGVVRYNGSGDLWDKLEKFRKGRIDKLRLLSAAAAYIHSERTLSRANAKRREEIKRLF